MTIAQVVETSVTVTNSSFQNYTHLDDHARQTTDTPGFKPFTMHTLLGDNRSIRIHSEENNFIIKSKSLVAKNDGIHVAPGLISHVMKL